MLPSNLCSEMKTKFAEELNIKQKVNTEASILVVTGANASGKSLLRRWFQVIFKKEYDTEVIHLSQQGRATEGLGRIFVYGSEDDESTGTISANTFIGGVRTMRARKNKHVVIWDEPEIGMGEELQVGSAEWLCGQLADWPEHLQGVIIMTHSRVFVKRMMKFPGAKWMSLDGYKTPELWLNREIVPIDPEEVQKKGRERWRKFGTILKRK